MAFRFNAYQGRREGRILFAPGYEPPYLPLTNIQNRLYYIDLIFLPGRPHINKLISEMVGCILPKSPHPLALMIKSKEMQIFFMMKFRLQPFGGHGPNNPPRCPWSSPRSRIRLAERRRIPWRNWKTIIFQERVIENEKRMRVIQIAQILQLQFLVFLQLMLLQLPLLQIPPPPPLPPPPYPPP